MLIVVSIAMIITKVFVLVIDFVVVKFLMNSKSNVFYKQHKYDDSDNSGSVWTYMIIFAVITLLGTLIICFIILEYYRQMYKA